MSNIKNIFPKKEPEYHYFFGNESVGGFEVDFYMTENKPSDCYVHIHGKSGNGGIFDVKLNGYSYGYLMASAQQGNEENIHGFCAMLFILATQIYQDNGLCNDVLKAINKYQKRLDKKAEEVAKSTTKEQEEADDALINDIIAEQSMSKKELKAKRESDHEMMREILQEKGS